jgi:hypothetical protein
VKELSLHILDIVQNSTNAKASEISIDLLEDLQANVFEIHIADNGCGIQEERLNAITDPFSTSRSTRRVGLGLSLLQAAAEQCDGSMTIQSREGQGTIVKTRFKHDHIDRVPLGDIVSTIITLISGHPTVEFSYRHRVNDKLFEFDTAVVKQELGDLPISEIAVLNFLAEYMQEHVDNLYKETDL